MGIEPTSEAWEALNKTLKAIDLAALSFASESLNWNVWSAAELQAKNEGWQLVCANVFGLEWSQ